MADYILELQAAVPRMERIITDLLIRLKKCEACLE